MIDSKPFSKPLPKEMAKELKALAKNINKSNKAFIKGGVGILNLTHKQLTNNSYGEVKLTVGYLVHTDML